MEIQSNISLAALWFIIILIIVGGIVFVSYFFKVDEEEFNSLQRKILGALRSVALVGIAIFLLSIILEKAIRYEERPVLLLAIDNSASMLQKNEQLTGETKELIEEIKTKANSKYEVKQLTFGSEINESEEIGFTENISDYSSLMNYISDRYYNLNLGGVVLMGDGIYNVGRNPVQFAKKVPAPIYTLGFGDTTIFSDQTILNLHHNRSVFLGNCFQLEVEVNFTEFQHQKSKIGIYQGNKLIQEKEIRVPQANFYTTVNFSVEAVESGLQSYSVVLNSFDDEQNQENNYRRFNIRVHEDKYKVLVLTSAPHPDIGAIKSLLQEEANFQVSIAQIDKFDTAIDDFNTVVLYQVPSNNNNHDLIKSIVEKKKSILVVAGPATNLSALNNLQLGIELQPTTVFEELTPKFDNDFSIFGVPLDMDQLETLYPPLLTPFSKVEVAPSYDILAYQTINGVALDRPLILAGNYNQQKVAFILGEGLWRWGLQEYLNLGSKTYINQLVVNLLTYLSIDSKEDRFKLQYQQVVPENTPVRLRATLLNEIFEPVLDESIELVLTDSENVELNYVFDSGETTYSLNLGYLSEGKYNFKAKASIGKDTLLKKGSFIVQEIDVELQNTTANYNLLRSISSQTGGTFVAAENNEHLSEIILQDKNSQTKIHQVKSLSELIDLKWIFILVIIFLFAEWFLRKFWGSY